MNLSIIIPVYNGEKYIEECIDSIINQSFKDLEIIVVDDGSTDNTYKVVQEKMNKDERIKLFHKQNGGVSSARNMGIEQARGEYIMFVDADDYVIEESISEVVESVEKYKNEKLYIFSSNKLKKADGKYKVEEIIDELLLTFVINSPWSKVYKTNIINENNIRFNENLNIYEDLLFNINYIQYVECIIISNYQYYIYKQSNSNSLSKIYNENRYSILKYINDTIKNNLLVHDNKYLTSIIDYIRITYIWTEAINLGHRNCKKTFMEKIKIINNAKKENSNYNIRNIGIKKYIKAQGIMLCPSWIILILAKFKEL